MPTMTQEDGTKDLGVFEGLCKKTDTPTTAANQLKVKNMRQKGNQNVEEQLHGLQVPGERRLPHRKCDNIW